MNALEDLSAGFAEFFAECVPESTGKANGAAAPEAKAALDLLMADVQFASTWNLHRPDRPDWYTNGEPDRSRFELAVLRLAARSVTNPLALAEIGETFNGKHGRARKGGSHMLYQVSLALASCLDLERGRGAQKATAIQPSKQDQVDVSSHFVTGAEIMANPEAHEPPPATVPHLAWAGLLSGLCGDSKSGKTTLCYAGAAAVTSGGSFFGEPCTPGSVVWIGLEEPLAKVARSVAEMGGDLSRLHILRATPCELLTLIGAAAERFKPVLVVIDSLAQLSQRSGVGDSGASQQWARLMGGLVDVARSGPSVLFLHHVTKSTGGYRDSSAIAAASDWLGIMKKATGDARARRVEFESRDFGLGSWGWRLSDDGRLVSSWDGTARETVASTAELERALLARISEKPGCTLQQTLDATKGRDVAKREAIEQLKASGLIREKEGARGARLFWPATREEVGRESVA